MNSTLKILLLIINILAFLGCLFWWKKENGWEPKVATLTALSTLLIFIYGLNSDSKQNNTSVNASNNSNSPITGEIETQNNYYLPQPAFNEKSKPVENLSQPIKETDPVTSQTKKSEITTSKIKSDKTKPESKVIETNVTSINQQGGITAKEVNIYNEKPPMPILDLLTNTLNSINPEILKKVKSGINPICIMSQQYKIVKLLERSGELKENNLLEITSTGSFSSGNSNTIGNCLNDIQDGSLNGYQLFFLSNFKAQH